LEIGLLVLAAALVFGSKRLPELGRGLGQGLRGFGHGLKGDDEPAAAVAPPEPAEPGERA
jgi:sec-independent protein translocase protein TatA